jgi:hypothetical protein
MAANPETAVTVIKPDAIDRWEPKTLQILSKYPTAQYNVLVPTVSLRQVNPYLVPDIDAVQLDPNPEAGHIYHDPQMKAGHYGPTKVGLRLLAQVAGITTIASRRIDDGRDPDFVEWQVEIEMVQPSGRPIRGIGTKNVDLRPHMTKGWTAERLAKAHEHMASNAESKAMNRAIRSILSLRPSYPQRELAKPFAILRYVPDMTHPEVRARFLDMVAPTTAQLYGPGPDAAPKLVGPGADAGVDRAPEAPDDDQDDQAAAAFAEAQAAATAASTTPEEPAWVTGAAQAAAPSLVEALRSTAEASTLKGAMTKEQTSKLGSLRLADLRGTAESPASDLADVLRAAWGPEALQAITAAQAEGILSASDSFDTVEAFLDAWRAAAAAVREAAGS